MRYGKSTANSRGASGARAMSVDRKALRIANARLSASIRGLDVVHLYAKRIGSNTLCASGFALEKFLTTDAAAVECGACRVRVRDAASMDARGINNPKAVRPVERKPVQPHEKVEVCPTCEGRGVKAVV